MVEPSGSASFVVTSPNSQLHVTSGGKITTMDGPLPLGHYVAGTDSGANNDTGTWKSTLKVLPAPKERGDHDGDEH